MLARLGKFDLPKHNLPSLFAMQKESRFIGNMIFRKQVLRASHADRDHAGMLRARYAAFPPSTTSPA
jgi:hypothetical protein